MADGKNETIVDRVVQRLQTQPLGDLITEEDLHDIVKQAIPKVFFEPRVEVVGNGYRSENVTKPPRIVEAAEIALKASAQKAVDDWMVANADKVMEAWRPVFEKGIEKWVLDRQAAAMLNIVHTVLSPAFSQLNEERVRQGLPQIHY